MGTMFRSTRLCAFALALAAATLLSACTTTRMYVDPALPIYSESDLPHPAQPRPVALAFEFRSNGRPNPEVTASLRPRIVAVLKQSGLFSEVTSANGPSDGAQLKLVIDNEAETAGAARKGRDSSLTLGIAGSFVIDDYVCTASYEWQGKSSQVSVKHALRTAIGNQPGPPGQEPKEPDVAIHWVIDQIAWNALKNLADQRVFQ